VLGIQPGLDVLADQSARYRVAVPLYVDQAAAVHATAPSLAGFESSRRQRTQHGQLRGQALTSASIELFLDAVKKPRVLFAAGKISAATHQQRLLHCLFKAAVPLLDIAVLMGMIGLDLLTDHPVVIQQRLIPLRELLPLAQIIHRRAHPIRPVPRRHASQLRQRVLQPFAQALEALREADRCRLPVRVGQHEMVDHMLERLSLDHHAQVVHVCEV
jgi:hypothetical protein